MKFRFTNLAFCALFVFCGCKSRLQREMDAARAEVSRGNFRVALSYFDQITTRVPDSKLALEASREAARISFFEIQNYKKAAEYYQTIVLTSPDADERMSAQKQIVATFFDHVTDYPRAVSEINKLIVMLEDSKERNEYKIRLARAYYYQNNFAQAANEVEELLSSAPTPEQKFDMILLKGNIALAQKNLTGAVEIFKGLLLAFPERAVRDNVGLILSVCYE